MAKTNKSKNSDNPNMTTSVTDLREVLKRRGISVEKYLVNCSITNNMELMVHKRALETNSSYRLSEDFLREAVAHFSKEPVKEVPVVEEAETVSVTKPAKSKTKTR